MNQIEEIKLLQHFDTKMQGYRETTRVTFKASEIRDLMHLARMYIQENYGIEIKPKP